MYHVLRARLDGELVYEGPEVEDIFGIVLVACPRADDDGSPRSELLAILRLLAGLLAIFLILRSAGAHDLEEVVLALLHRLESILVGFHTRVLRIGPVDSPVVDFKLVTPDLLQAFPVSLHACSTASKLPAVAKSVWSEAAVALETHVVSQTKQLSGSHHGLREALCYTFVPKQVRRLQFGLLVQIAFHLLFVKTVHNVGEWIESRALLLPGFISLAKACVALQRFIFLFLSLLSSHLQPLRFLILCDGIFRYVVLSVHQCPYTAMIPL